MIIIKGYEKLGWSKEIFDKFYELANDYSFIPAIQLGCVESRGLDSYPRNSHECLNDYCGKCWKQALSKDYD